MNKNGKIAIFQILILFIGFIAFVNSIGFVSGGRWSDLKAWARGGSNAASSDTGFFNTPWSQRGGSSTLSKVFNIGGETASGGGELFTTWQQGSFYDAFFSGVQWYFVAKYTVLTLGPMIGLTDEETEALSESAGRGFGSYKMSKIIIDTLNPAASMGWSIGIGIAVALYTYASEYEEIAYRVVSFDCKPYKAETFGEGESRCEECNTQDLPCSEYQCRALGQGCKLVNVGEEGEELCVEINPNDVLPPEITSNEDVLKEGYSYEPTVAVNPPDRGVEIIFSETNDGCVPAFTPLTFGITLDEPAYCKADYIRNRRFENMRFDFGENSISKYNHTQTMNLPGPGSSSSEHLLIRNDGEQTIYVKCEDEGGNPNENNFVFKFCVQKGPDTTVPIVKDTSISNEMPVPHDQDTLDFTLYLDNPAECKWSTEDKDYNTMENAMDCVTGIEDYITKNAVNVYPCETILTGIKNEQENNFYFRCKDQPLEEESERNTNSESYVHTIIGTKPLYIESVGPNGTVRDSTEDVEVTLTAETSAGYNEGQARCKFKEVGTDNIPVEFLNSNSWKHSTNLGRPEGEYAYEIICEDLGGNSDSKVVEFEVESDTEAPIITRAFKKTGDLQIITDEEAECVYDTSGCNYLYEDGIGMLTSEKDKTVHTTGWNTKTKFYVKCSDEYGNKPNSNECSAIIKALE